MTYLTGYIVQRKFISNSIIINTLIIYFYLQKIKYSTNTSFSKKYFVKSLAIFTATFFILDIITIIFIKYYFHKMKIIQLKKYSSLYCAVKYKVISLTLEYILYKEKIKK